MLQVFSKSVHPAALSTFAKGFRTQKYFSAANMKSQSMRKSSLPESAGQFSGMVWGKSGLMAQHLGDWSGKEGAVQLSGHQPSYPGTGSGLFHLVQI